MVLQPEVVLIFVAAVVPPLVLAALVVRVVRPRPWSGLAATTAFLWGAAVTTSLALVANQLVGSWAAAYLGDARVRALALIGPTVEELAKGTGFVAVALVSRGVLASVRASLAVGALIGLGFAAAENVSYHTLAAVQGGWVGLARAVYLRGGIQGLNHAAFTATTGAAVGWTVRQAAPRRRTAAVVSLGLAGAIAAHALWNALASVAITEALCGAQTPGGPCATAPDATTLFVTVPLLVLAAIGPLGLGLGWLARREPG